MTRSARRDQRAQNTAPSAWIVTVVTTAYGDAVEIEVTARNVFEAWTAAMNQTTGIVRSARAA